MSNEQAIVVMGVRCFPRSGRAGVRVWRGGMRAKARAQRDEPWRSVRVECHATRDGSEHWVVIRKVSFRDGDPGAWGSGTRHKARFYFEGQGPTLEVAADECAMAEDYFQQVRSP